MSLKQIRLSAQAKDQLIRLKTRTGIGQWNILCRWAFCLSLCQPNVPTPIEIPADWNQAPGSGVRGQRSEVRSQRRARDGLGTADDVLSRQFRLHLHRGIRYLATPYTIRSYPPDRGGDLRSGVSAGSGNPRRAPAAARRARAETGRPLTAFRPALR
jgi:DNA sulfur modification protein DndE